MRDLLILLIVVPGAVIALRRPWVGIMLWTWLSLMNPHRYAYGFAYSAPLAAMVAAATLVGLLITSDKRSFPVKGIPVVWFVLFTVWMTISWLAGLDPKGDYEQWDKVMKINLMTLVGLALLHSKRHVFVFAWVTVLSLALLGAKGGVFTVLTGGSYRVWGPPGTFIQDNNEFALALIVVIPLLRFLQLQLQDRWGRHAMSFLILMCAASAFGSHSRGALLAISAMSLLLWWRSGKHRVASGVAFAVVGCALVLFMPDHWGERMATIQTYDEDASAMGRISAWWCAWNLAFDYPAGVGFNMVRPELFAIYSPYPNIIQSAHSIYFQVLGHHGFVGLALYLGMWVATWFSAGWLRRHGASRPETRWCADLGSMCQVSLLGFAVGGAFLSLSYFDLPYIVMSLVVLTRAWLAREAWKTEPATPPRNRWLRVPGLYQSTAPQA